MSDQPDFIAQAKPRHRLNPLQGLIDEYQSAVEGRRAHVLNLCARINALADELVPSLEEAITAEEACLDALLEAAAARLVNPARPFPYSEL